MKQFFNSKTIFFSSAIILWLAAAAILSDLTEDVINADPIVNFDKYWAGIFFNWRSAFGVDFFSVVTLLGTWQLIVPVLIAVLFFVFKKYQAFFWPFVFTLASAESVTFIGKILVHRYRPDGAVMVESDFSFPSGHATIAVALYGYLAYLIIKQLKIKTARIAVLSGSLFLILIIGFSRLYLGVHYISDVIAGYLVGLLALILGISFREWHTIKSNRKLSLK